LSAECDHSVLIREQVCRWLLLDLVSITGELSGSS
jgi:hypothetical protein